MADLDDIVERLETIDKAFVSRPRQTANNLLGRIEGAVWDVVGVLMVAVALQHCGR